MSFSAEDIDGLARALKEIRNFCESQGIEVWKIGIHQNDAKQLVFGIDFRLEKVAHVPNP